MCIQDKHEDDYGLSTLLVRNKSNDKLYTTYLPRGVYDSLSLCGYVEIDPLSPFRVEKFKELV